LKHKFIILLLILSLVLPACTSTEVPEPSVEKRGEPIAPYPYIPMTELLDFYTLDEYETYFKILPDNFVSYEMVSCFGEFYGYVSSPPNIVECLYSFQDEHGNELYLNIYIKDPSDPLSSLNHSSIPVIEDVSDPENLLYNASPTSNGAGAVFIDGIRYRYVKGALANIAWESEMHYFSLALKHYVPGSNAYVERLLRQDTAVTAIQDLNYSIERALEN